MPIYKFLERLDIQRAVLERRDEGGNGTLEHDTLLFHCRHGNVPLVEAFARVCHQRDLKHQTQGCNLALSILCPSGKSK
jgi:hypothetical protein